METHCTQKKSTQKSQLTVAWAPQYAPKCSWVLLKAIDPIPFQAWDQSCPNLLKCLVM